MLFKIYVGIDISKLRLDVFIREKEVHNQFSNDSKGFLNLTKWVEKQSKIPLENVLFCFEHTGLYSLSLALFLEKHQMHFSMLPALEIKRSLGITRGKNDLIDAKRIAEFAYRFSDKVSMTKLPPASITKLQSLLSLRDRLSRSLGGHVSSKNEFLRIMGDEYLPELLCSYDKIILTIKEEIKQLEKSIKILLNENNDLRISLELITSIKGIGLIIGAYLIVHTHNFTRFDNWRKFACYAGIAPFNYQSGTSVRGKTQVSSIANLQIKKLLHLGAVCAIYRDAELREYYQRRLTEGKNRMSVINIVRNKLVARVFAVVKRGTPFVDVKKYIA